MLDQAAVALKALTYAGALTAAGIVLARISLRRVDTDGRLAHSTLRTAGMVLALLAPAAALVYLLRLGAGWDAPMLAAVFASPLGAALALQFAGGLGLASMRRGAAHTIAAVLVLACVVVSGHAASRGWLPVTVLVAHVAAAAWWTGGLWLLLAASRRMTGEAYFTLVRGFSGQALIVVAFLLLAGLLEAALLLRFNVDLSRDYDRGLAIKVLLALALLCLAALNRQVLLPALKIDPARVSPLRLSLRVELGLIAAIAASTAWITTHVGLHEATAVQPRIVAVVGGLAIVDPWASRTPPGGERSAGYVTLRNDSGQADRLIGASSPHAARVGLHTVTQHGQLVFMREADGFDIPAGGELVLSSGVAHLMFEFVDAPFEEGELIDVTLRFAQRGDVEVLFPVQRGADDHAAAHVGVQAP